MNKLVVYTIGCGSCLYRWTKGMYFRIFTEANLGVPVDELAVRSKHTQTLIQMVCAERDQYTEEALLIAEGELKSRNVPFIKMDPETVRKEMGKEKKTTINQAIARRKRFVYGASIFIFPAVVLAAFKHPTIGSLSMVILCSLFLYFYLDRPNPIDSQEGTNSNCKEE